MFLYFKNIVNEKRIRKIQVKILNNSNRKAQYGSTGSYINYIKTKLQNFRNYKNCKNFIQALNIFRATEYRTFISHKRSTNVPKISED